MESKELRSLANLLREKAAEEVSSDTRKKEKLEVFVKAATGLSLLSKKLKGPHGN